jgi:hypothetical protein
MRNSEAQIVHANALDVADEMGAVIFIVVMVIVGTNVLDVLPQIAMGVGA